MPGRKHGRRPRLALNGLEYFCRRYSSLLNGERWDVPYRPPTSAVNLAARFTDVARCDLGFSYNGRITMGKFLRVARALGKTKIIMVWCGSDVLFAKDEFAQGRLDPWVTQRVHWAVSPWMAEEVRSLGVDCEYVPAAQFVYLVKNPKPLPKKFSVLLFVRDADRTQLYGWDRMVEVAQELPHIQFNLHGLPEGQTLVGPPNIKVHNWTNDFTPWLEQSTVVYRPVRHDGLSVTVLEALSHGRHVIYSYPLPGCFHASSAVDARNELERLHAAHESGTLALNEIGRDYVAANHSADFARSELPRRFEMMLS